MSWLVITALIVSGVFVGFINTLAGGGTIISLSLFMLLGLPANIANGTNRVAVILQNLTSVSQFRKQNLLDFKKANKLAIPTMIGAMVGAQIASDINENIFRKAVAVVMLVMVYFIVTKPSQWLKGTQALQEKPVSWLQVAIFFLIGVYGGFVQVGVGYFILAGVVLGAGYDLVKANAIKVWIVLLYTPLALIIFILNDQVNWTYGLVHAIGNIIGAFIASRFAVSWGANFVRWVIIVVILVFSSDLLGIINIREMITQI
ncbi:MAG TPA: sulfite exporter TauE/SafE family protein [Bacteroidales bacterium]|nr:sulfite exporter TauE/SafE family protein [Bacteroidales bacterium]